MAHLAWHRDPYFISQSHKLSHLLLQRLQTARRFSFSLSETAGSQLYGLIIATPAIRRQ